MIWGLQYPQKLSLSVPFFVFCSLGLVVLARCGWAGSVL